MSTTSDYMRVLAQLEEAKGQALGQGVQRSGEIWGQTIQNMGQTLPGQIMTAIKTGQIQNAIRDAGGDLMKALPRINQIDPVGGSQLTQQLIATQKNIAEYHKIENEAAQSQWKFDNDRLNWALNNIDSAVDDHTQDVAVASLAGAGFPQLAQLFQGKTFAESAPMREYVRGRLMDAVKRNPAPQMKDIGGKMYVWQPPSGAQIQGGALQGQGGAPPPTPPPTPQMQMPPAGGAAAAPAAAAPVPGSADVAAPPAAAPAAAAVPSTPAPTPTPALTLTGAPTTQTGYDWLLSTPGLTQQERSSIRTAAERNSTKQIMPSVWTKAFPGVGPGKAEQMWQASVDRLVTGGDQAATPSAAPVAPVAPTTPAAAAPVTTPTAAPPAAPPALPQLPPGAGRILAVGPEPEPKNVDQWENALIDPNNPYHAQAPAWLAAHRANLRAASGSEESRYLDKYAQDIGKGSAADLTKDETDKAIQELANARKAKNVSTPLTDDSLNRLAAQYNIDYKSMPTRYDQDQKNQIVNRATEITRRIGQSDAITLQKQVEYKADTKAYTQLTGMQASALGFEVRWQQQAQLIRTLSNQLDRTEIQHVNEFVQGLRTELNNSVAIRLANALTTGSEEYAKIIAGITGNGRAATDDVRKTSQRLLSAYFSKGTMSDVLDQMNQEVDFTMNGYDYARTRISEKMIGAVPNPNAPPAGTKTTPTGPDTTPSDKMGPPVGYVGGKPVW